MKKKRAEYVPAILQIGAAWSWRLLLILGVAAALIWSVRPIYEVVVALFLAMLLNVMLTPLVGFLRRRVKLNRTGAAAVGLLVGVVVVVGLFAVSLDQLIRKIPSLAQQTIQGVNSVLEWINNSWVGTQSDQLRDWITDVQNNVLNAAKSNSAYLAGEALGIAASTVGVLASALIMLFTLFFLLRDGRGIWIWVLRMLPEAARYPVNEAAIRGWVTLGGYVRTQVEVAAINAIGIGAGALILKVPLAIPITVLVFLGSFVPILGAFVSGAVAVFVALVNNGLTTAIIMLVVVVVVMQLESHVLQPWLMSSAVSIHPLAVVLSVSVGTIIGGIPGALFAVPLVSFVNVVVLYLHGHDTMPLLSQIEDRPGGPPGSLNEQIKASYRVVPGWEQERLTKEAEGES